MSISRLLLSKSHASTCIFGEDYIAVKSYFNSLKRALSAYFYAADKRKSQMLWIPEVLTLELSFSCDTLATCLVFTHLQRVSLFTHIGELQIGLWIQPAVVVNLKMCDMPKY